jgi:O-antigen/teichoic acid export membrane protein
MLAGGAGAATAAAIVFAATMIVRIPVYLFQGVAASLLPNLTRLQALDDAASFRRALARTAGVLLAGGAGVVVFGASIGPEVLRLLYGQGFEAGRLELALLGAGVGCYLAAATFSQALLALDRTRAAAAAWAVVALGYVGLYALLPGTELHRVSVAFVSAAAVGLVLLVGLVVRRRA